MRDARKAEMGAEERAGLEFLLRLFPGGRVEVFISRRTNRGENGGVVFVNANPQILDRALRVLGGWWEVGALASRAQHGQAQDTVHRDKEILSPNDRLEFSDESPRAAFRDTADCWMDQGCERRPLNPSSEPHADQEQEGVVPEALERAQPSSPSTAREGAARQLLRRQCKWMRKLKGQLIMPQLSQSLGKERREGPPRRLSSCSD